jgi:hypothetical protein
VVVWFSLVILDWITGPLAMFAPPSPIAACTGIMRNPMPKCINPHLVIDVMGALFLFVAR